MRKLSYISLLAGLVILTLLLVWGGIAEVLQLLTASGWSLLWLPIVSFPSIMLTVFSWRLLFIAPRIPSFRHLLAAMWMGRAINVLLPVATIGGEIARARLVTLWGANAVEASAAVLVDKTIQALCVIVWGIVGIILLFRFTTDPSIAYPAMLGAFLLSLCIIGFIFVQHAGMFGGISSLLSRLIPADSWTNINSDAREVDRVVRELYQDRGRIGMAVWCRTASLIMETTEIWLACYLFHHPIGIPEALLLRSMVTLLNSIMFFIPNAYGIQEGGFIMVGKLIGLSPELALAVSLATRIREFIIDLPGLLIWQFIESKQLLLRKT